jgi:DNA-binding NarL/FixJ family response regulator
MDQFRSLAIARADSPGTAPTEAAEVARPVAGTPGAEPLSEKEGKLLELIAEGMTNRQIAATLSLAEGTVKNYISRIMEKLHANTRTELAMMTRRHPRSE